MINNIDLLKKFQRRITSISCKAISNTEIRQFNPSFNHEMKNDPVVDPKNLEKLEKEYSSHQHWLNKYTQAPFNLFRAPYHMRIFDEDKDTEFGKYVWNSNGAFPNRLANILYNSPALQSRTIMRFFTKWFDYQHAQEATRAEEQPKITPNSVFLYRDPTNNIVNRRSVERFAVFMVATMAWNIPTVILYAFIGYYFNILQKNIATSMSMTYRMDLIPETEQLHIVKIGTFGIPYSTLVNIKDLVKISREEDKSCIYFFYLKLFYYNRLYLQMA